MGWGNCGTDSKGRPIGYVFEATCDYPGCEEEIDRGLSYACGGMHGEDENGCEGYFCGKHLSMPWDDEADEPIGEHDVCPDCKKLHEEADKTLTTAGQDRGA